LLTPKKVVREDGIRAAVPELRSFKEELRDVLLVATDKNMLRLMLLFFSSNFYYTYVFQSVNGKLHTARTRGLNSAFFWAAQMVGSVLFAKTVDQERLTVYKRARRGFFLVLIVMSVSWALGIYLQLGYKPALRVTDEDRIDFKDFGDWFYTLITQIGYGLADSLIQTFSYWFMSILAGDNAQLAARYAGFYKGVQSLGAAIAWLLDSEYINATAETQLWVCVALFVVGMIPTFWVVQDLSKQSRDQSEIKAESKYESSANAPESRSPLPMAEV